MSTTAAQIAANIANAQLSTGPRTDAGKAASAQNNFRHGLVGTFVIQSWENADHYDDLLDTLRNEHEPANPTEALLVEQMAQHRWLAQRALRLQELTFDTEVPLCTAPKELDLYMRYQSNYERAFSRCLNDLRKLRSETEKETQRFARRCSDNQRQRANEKRQEAVEQRRTEMHAARLAALAARSKKDEASAAAKLAVVRPQPVVFTTTNSEIGFEPQTAFETTQAA